MYATFSQQITLDTLSGHTLGMGVVVLCGGEHSQHGHSFHEEGAWSFCIPCLRTVYLKIVSFRASGIKMCTPGYAAVVACLCLQV